MTLFDQIRCAAAASLARLFPDQAFSESNITINQTKPEFEGDYTIVLFPFVKALRMKPDQLGKMLGEHLLENTSLFSGYQIVSGFLNMQVKEAFWYDFLLNHFNDTVYGEQTKKDRRVMVEYSSPNTNKPLHFGHLRNIFLGFSIAEILKAAGNQVVKANLINDRGIHICKSMIAWQHYSHGATPESTGIKGDHLVGDYYVRFNDWSKEATTDLVNEANRILQNAKEFEIEVELQSPFNRAISDLASAGESSNDDMKNNPVKWFKELQLGWISIYSRSSNEKVRSTILEAINALYTGINDLPLSKANEMLLKWEAGDPEVKELWARMNGWVYEGFDVTYKKLGVDFDKRYYESDTYLLGKDIVTKGVGKGVLFKKEDGSVWIDLTDEGLDQKLLLRSDGTSVYMTQDLGTALLKYDDYKLDQSIYVIADEQNYHMQVLKLVLKKLGEAAADGIYHLSYGMVELPTGKMKSREGTVVDADDMISEMITLSKAQTEAAGKTEGFSQEELDHLYEMIGMGALKFYLLRVDPKKKMIFNPEESIDLHGYTATFIQYAHARICSILRKQGINLLPDNTKFQSVVFADNLFKAEKDLLVQLEQYPVVVSDTAADYNPSLICNYAFTTAQIFNTFVEQHSIAKAESEEKKALRVMLIVMTAQLLRHSMHLLGIRLPEKM